MPNIRAKIINKVKYCSCCGIKIFHIGYNLQDRIVRKMESDNLCYDCAFWKDLALYKRENMEIVGNYCLTIYPEVVNKDKSMFLGSKGKLRYFMKPDLTPYRSNDVWLIGKIPDRFISLFPPTAYEITLRTYNSLMNSTKRCQAIGCMDRYHCIRYKIELEKDNPPFNTVPKSWKIGGERCKFFLNKINIIGDEKQCDPKSN